MDIDYKQGLTLYLILLASLSVHEWAHAFVADKLGDHTPRSQGRVTFNPIAHIDPIGTVFIPLFMILFSPGFAIIGWGKPVMVNPLNFRNRVRDDILVSMAGPASNVVICLLMVFIGGVLLKFMPAIAGLLGQVILLNCVLIIFNMIPIPPLDGSHLLKHAVGMRDETYLNFARWGFLILIILINIPAFRQVFGVAIYLSADFFYKLMLLIVG
jgi:Zn-dependent protease